MPGPGPARGSASTGAVLLDGLHLLSDALAAGVPVTAAAAPEAFWQSPAGAPLAGALARAGAMLYAAKPRRARSGQPGEDADGHRRHRALASRPTSARVLAAQPALVVCAVHVQDPGNVGAIIRAAEAAGATGAVMTAGSADPFGWKALRGSMGSAFRLPVAAGAPVEPCAGEARAARRAHRLDVAVRREPAVHDVDLTGPVLVLVGGEGRGPARAPAGRRRPCW